MGLLQRLRRARSEPELWTPTYTNTAVVERLEREEGVDRDTAVDKAWHAFLLHTRDYEAYCNERFGRLIHHQPTGEPDPRAYRRSYEARQRYAGGAAADPVLWAVPASTADSSGGDRDGRAGPHDSPSDVGGGDSGGGDSGGGSSCGGGGCGGGGS